VYPFCSLPGLPFDSISIRYDTWLHSDSWFHSIRWFDSIRRYIRLHSTAISFDADLFVLYHSGVHSFYRPPFSLGDCSISSITHRSGISTVHFTYLQLPTFYITTVTIFWYRFLPCDTTILRWNLPFVSYYVGISTVSSIQPPTVFYWWLFYRYRFLPPLMLPFPTIHSISFMNSGLYISWLLVGTFDCSTTTTDLHAFCVLLILLRFLFIWLYRCCSFYLHSFYCWLEHSVPRSVPFWFLFIVRYVPTDSYILPNSTLPTYHLETYHSYHLPFLRYFYIHF